MANIHIKTCSASLIIQFSSVQSLSHVWLFETPWIAARQASLSITNSLSSLKLMSIESVMPSSHLILCRPLLLLPPIPPSIRVFSNESILHIRWPKYWCFSFSIIPSKEHPGLISFRMDWLDLLAVQGTFKSIQNANKNYNEISLHTVRMAVIKETTDNKCGWRCAKNRTAGWNVNWCHHCGKQYGVSSENKKTELPYEAGILLLGIYPKKTKALIWKDICTSMEKASFNICKLPTRRQNYFCNVQLQCLMSTWAAF